MYNENILFSITATHSYVKFHHWCKGLNDCHLFCHAVLQRFVPTSLHQLVGVSSVWLSQTVKNSNPSLYLIIDRSNAWIFSTLIVYPWDGMKYHHFLCFVNNNTAFWIIRWHWCLESHLLSYWDWNAKNKPHKIPSETELSLIFVPLCFNRLCRNWNRSCACVVLPKLKIVVFSTKSVSFRWFVVEFEDVFSWLIHWNNATCYVHI